MEEVPHTGTTKEIYNGCQILLTPTQQDDETWVGEYVVIDLAKTKTPYTSGYTEDRFLSSNTARAAALLRAITVIDSRTGTSDTASHIPLLEVPMIATSSYNGREIKLRSGQQADGTWTCEVTILGRDSTRTVILTGYSPGSYSTREEAEAAALEVAQGTIDSNRPPSSIN